MFIRRHSNGCLAFTIYAENFQRLKNSLYLVKYIVLQSPSHRILRKV